MMFYSLCVIAASLYLVAGCATFLMLGLQPTNNVDFLLSSEKFARLGSIFWPDLTRMKRDRSIWKIMGCMNLHPIIYQVCSFTNVPARTTRDYHVKLFAPRLVGQSYPSHHQQAVVWTLATTADNETMPPNSHCGRANGVIAKKCAPQKCCLV